MVGLEWEVIGAREKKQLLRLLKLHAQEKWSVFTETVMTGFVQKNSKFCLGLLGFRYMWSNQVVIFSRQLEICGKILGERSNLKILTIDYIELKMN